jgi:hypothetical protein
MKAFQLRLERVARLLSERCLETIDLFTDEEKTEIAKIFREIHGFRRVYHNKSWQEVGLIPDGFICFRNGEVFDEITGELFPSLEAAQRKHPGIQVIPADAGLVEKLFNALKKGERGLI